jgi:hypothetical protein
VFPSPDDAPPIAAEAVTTLVGVANLAVRVAVVVAAEWTVGPSIK